MIRALCIAAFACLAIPGVATAKEQQPTTKQAEFKATLKGSQVTTWTFNRPFDEADPCIPSGSGFGDSSIYFEAKDPLRLKFIAPPKDDPNLFNSKGRPLVVTDPAPYRLDARAERDTDMQFGQPSPLCDADNGGGVEPDLRPKDCGERKGTIQARFYFFDGLRANSRKNRLKLETADPDYGSETGDLEDTYENCQLDNLRTEEHAGVARVASGKLSEKQVFNERKKTFRVSGSYITPVEGAFYTGKTIVAWNLKLKRVN